MQSIARSSDTPYILPPERIELPPPHLQQDIPESTPEEADHTPPEERIPAPIPPQAGEISPAIQIADKQALYEQKRERLALFLQQTSLVHDTQLTALTLRDGLCYWFADILHTLHVKTEDPQLPLPIKNDLFLTFQAFFQYLFTPATDDKELLSYTRALQNLIFLKEHYLTAVPSLDLLPPLHEYREFFERPIYAILKTEAIAISKSTHLKTLTKAYLWLEQSQNSWAFESPQNPQVLFDNIFQCPLLSSERRNRLIPLQKLIHDNEQGIKTRQTKIDQYSHVLCDFQKHIDTAYSVITLYGWISCLNQSSIKHTQALEQTIAFWNPIVEELFQTLPQDEDLAGEHRQSVKDQLSDALLHVMKCQESLTSGYYANPSIGLPLLARVTQIAQLSPSEQKQYNIIQWATTYGLLSPVWEGLTIRQAIGALVHHTITELFRDNPPAESIGQLPITAQRSIVVWLKSICEFLSQATSKTPEPLSPLLIASCEGLKQTCAKQLPWIQGLNILLDAQEFFDQILRNVCGFHDDDLPLTQQLDKIVLANQWVMLLQPPIDHLEQIIKKSESLHQHTLLICLLNLVSTLPLSQSRLKHIQQCKNTLKDQSEPLICSSRKYAKIIQRKQIRSDQVTPKALQEEIHLMQSTLDEHATIRHAFCETTIIFIDNVLHILPHDTQFTIECNAQISEPQKQVSLHLLQTYRQQFNDIKGVLFFIRSFIPSAKALFQRDLEMLLELNQQSLQPEKEQAEAEDVDRKELQELLSVLEPEGRLSAPCIQRKKPKSPPPRVSTTPPPPPLVQELIPAPSPAAEPQAPPSSATCLLDFLRTNVHTKHPRDIPAALTSFAALHTNFLARPTGRLSPIPGACDSTPASILITLRKKGLCNHLYLTACGFEALTNLLIANRLDLLPGVIPTWIADRYLIVELHGTTHSILNQQGLPMHHSLVELKACLALNTQLPGPLHKYIDQLTGGLLWYRYSDVAHLPNQETLLSDWNWIQRCNRCSVVGQEFDSSSIPHLLEFIVQKYQGTYELMYHTLSASTSEEGLEGIKDSLTACLQRWKDMQSSHSASPVHKAPSTMLLELNQLVTIARERYQLYTRQYPRTQKAGILKEIVTHLSRLANTIELSELFSIPHLSAFYYRNLLNIQWLIEHSYKFACLAHGLPIIRSHKLMDYEQVLSQVQETRILSSLEELRDYNCGVSLHYESLSRLQAPPFEQYKAMLEHDRAESLAGEEFTPTQRLAFDSRTRFQEHAARIVGVLVAKLTPFFERIT